jgi:hypothetical protein
MQVYVRSLSAQQDVLLKKIDANECTAPRSATPPAAMSRELVALGSLELVLCNSLLPS